MNKKPKANKIQQNQSKRLEAINNYNDYDFLFNYKLWFNSEIYRKSQYNLCLFH